MVSNVRNKQINNDMKRLYAEYRVATETCEICDESFVEGDVIDWDHIDRVRHEDGYKLSVTRYNGRKDGGVGSVSYQRFLEEHDIVRPLHKRCHVTLNDNREYDEREEAIKRLNHSRYEDILPPDFLEWINN